MLFSLLLITFAPPPYRETYPHHIIDQLLEPADGLHEGFLDLLDTHTVNDPCDARRIRMDLRRMFQKRLICDRSRKLLRDLLR